MPQTSLSVSVDLTVYSVSCPGVFLRDKDDIFVEICLFGKHSQTQSVPGFFPLYFNERFKFYKVYYDCSNPLELADKLREETMMIEVVQRSSDIQSGVVLASVEVNTHEFLFPYPTSVPVYSGTDRELLLNRTMHFDGISPKIEFSTRTTVTGVQTTASDELRDKVSQINHDNNRADSSRFSASRSLSRSRSAKSNKDDKPPFVVRKPDRELLKSMEPLASTVAPKRGRRRRAKRRPASSKTTKPTTSSREVHEDVGVEYTPEESEDEDTGDETRALSAPGRRRSSIDEIVDRYSSGDIPASASSYAALMRDLDRKRLLLRLERESSLASLSPYIYYDPYLESLEAARRRRQVDRELDRLYSRLYLY